MSKIKSRKFIVWISTIVIFIVAVIVTKTVTDAMINMVTVIGIVYIGGNTAQKYLPLKKEE